MNEWNKVSDIHKGLFTIDEQIPCYFIGEKNNGYGGVTATIYRGILVLNKDDKFCWYDTNNQSRTGYGYPQVSSKAVKYWLEIPAIPPLPEEYSK